MPRDEVDISAITNEPRKRTLSAYVRNQDNISGDRDQYVKRIKQTINPGVFSNISYDLHWFYIQRLGTPLERDSESVNHHNQSPGPTTEEIQSENTNLRNKKPPQKTLDNISSAEDDDPTSIRPRKKNRKRTLESSEEDEDEVLPSSVQPQKKVRVSLEGTIRKNKKKKLTSKKSSKNHQKSASDDSDVELVENGKENPPKTPENELGK